MKPYKKINFYYGPAVKWWNQLSINDKVDFKNRFEIYRNLPEVIKQNYPHMYDMRHIRISQLSDKYIARIWVFKDKI